MIHHLQHTLIARIEQIGIAPGDSDEVRLQKTSLLAGAFMFILAGAIWGMLYIALDEPVAGIIPLSYAIVSALNVVLFAITRRYLFFRFSQLFLILLLPFLLMIALGGFINSSAVILWSLICPLGALVFADKRSAPRWLLAYLGLLVVSGLLQASSRPSNNLSPALITLFFVLNIGAMSLIVFVLLRYFIGQQATLLNLLRQEQAKTRRLLLNVLPEEIADRLKEADGAVQNPDAQRFEAITILFADVVGFTPLSTRLSPEAMVDLLNDIFSHFDSLAAAYDVEKIRTIGDNYMAVAGAPRPRPDHAHAMALMSLEMSRFIDENPMYQDLGIRFRIGINSGAAVAAVIGRTKFHYDVWGDAVNVASRMESHGLPGKIQIGRPTYELIKEAFICEPRGLLEIKGKGAMETWFLSGLRN